jgi:hypothetical protein
MIIPIKSGPLYRQRLKEAIEHAALHFNVDKPGIENHVLSQIVSIGFQMGWQAHREGLTKAVESLNIGEEGNDDGNDGKGRK